MLDNIYAVVKNTGDGKPKGFSYTHVSYDMAKEEAERLCRKEHAEFFIIRVIAKCHIDEQPVKWEE